MAQGILSRNEPRVDRHTDTNDRWCYAIIILRPCYMPCMIASGQNRFGVILICLKIHIFSKIQVWLSRNLWNTICIDSSHWNVVFGAVLDKIWWRRNEMVICLNHWLLMIPFQSMVIINEIPMYNNTWFLFKAWFIFNLWFLLFQCYYTFFWKM